MNFTFNPTFEMMDAPIIMFSNPTLAEHRLMVMVKCFMVFALEHKEPDMLLVHRLQTHLVNGYMALCFIMITLSAELIWKAVPIMMFCYACQLQKLYVLAGNVRRYVSYMGFVFCCLEFASFEFVYDFFFILCFLFKSLYSLTQYKDLEQRERNGLHRVSMLLIFLVEMVVALNPHWIVFNVFVFKAFVFANAVVAFSHCIHNEKTLQVVVLFIVLCQIFIFGVCIEVDIDKTFGEVLDYLKNSFVSFLLQFSFSGLLQ